MSPDVDDPHGAIRTLNITGLVLLVLLVSGVGGWAITSQLVGAVIAPGTLVAESNNKKVQHPTGGIVVDIRVKEGSLVEVGEIVLRLDSTLTNATLGIVRSQLNELLAREARLLAEREGALEIIIPETLSARRGETSVGTAILGEEKLFESRRNARAGLRAQLRERIAQVSEEIRGLSAQFDAKEQEIKLIDEELIGVGELYQKKLITIIRYMQLLREQAKINGEHGMLVADIARARGKVTEIELQIIQIDQDFRTEVLRDLRDAQGKLAELKERHVAAEDQLRRADIRSPQAGTVHQLSVHTIGGVVGQGETIMQVVPRADKLVVEVKVAPQDVDQLVIGSKVTVRIMAGNQRTMPDVAGVLTRISADLTRDSQTNQVYYVVRVSLDEEQVRGLHDLTLVPGMPAEAFIQTQERTPLQYLLGPLSQQIARTFRER